MNRFASTALAGSLAVALLSGPAIAVPSTSVEQSNLPTETATVGLVLDVDEESLDRVLAALSKSSSAEAAQSSLETTLKAKDLTALAHEVGLPADALFVQKSQIAARRSFVDCIKSSVGDDLKSFFSVNAIAALIGQEKYVEAAKKAVEYLAKQGIKRNAAGLAATLGFYGARCAIFG